MSFRRCFFSSVFLVLVAVSTFAKEIVPPVIVWPETGAPVLRFIFGKFRAIGGVAGQRTYITDTTVVNLWNKKIPMAIFSLYLFDKDKARIGSGYISISNVGPGETIKFQTTVNASGTPVSFSLSPESLPRELGPKAPPRMVTITVNSVPQGALLRVDGAEVGTTPKLVSVGVGKHTLEFSKEGFNAGKFPLEVGPDDVSGGSVSYELGVAAYDTIELRDGSVLSGDLLSISGMDVTVRVAGNLQHLDRNKIKRIILTEREVPTAPQLPPAQANQ
jgi:PEGA domain